ncbi:uncharacterized protein PV09_03433 [Verruconis gallopava]|uniref:MOSC domain-containing protein n=1 Tax=Verruconis gallopava TaxID=253628 RepID=A0A0D2AGA6_9PEZI|nr:uncharacterized protein PV09_03433 [Verruconis gallopava]KIW05555.1 hypothetical protein PV09_03433 [Verruconis gallopava]
MEVTQIFIYPIKSLRGVAVEKATITKYGFLYDRCYMLIREDITAANVQKKHGSMLVGLIPEMALFTTAIELPSDESQGHVTVTFNPPGATSSSLVVPLVPETAGLDRLDVDLHGSKTSAYDMGDKYGKWFSERFGYGVKLAAVGEHERDILFPGFPFQQPSTSSWLASLARSIPVVGGLIGSQEPRLKFQDCAPFLVCTEKSCDAVSDLLSDAAKFDIRKTRPNIVVSGQQAWEEDFWGEIVIAEGDSEVKIPLQHNCLRCQSLNVDFATGQYSKEKNVEVLKLLQKYRRVDAAKKYNAVFGRYGFITPADVGKEIKVGDVVVVSKKNAQRSGFGINHSPRSLNQANTQQIGQACRHVREWIVHVFLRSVKAMETIGLLNVRIAAYHFLGNVTHD